MTPAVSIGDQLDVLLQARALAQAPALRHDLAVEAQLAYVQELAKFEDVVICRVLQALARG